MNKHSSTESANEGHTTHHSKKQSRHKSRHDMLHVGRGMNRLVRLLEKFHCLASSSKLNSSMIQQLFTSLFFLANTTLFNTLMEPVSASKFFNWQRGTHMRLNLDHMLRWAKHHNYTDISLKYFTKLNSLLDLISIPKHELIKSPWKALSEAFKALNSTQLHHILTNYQVLHMPSSWSPSPPLSLLSTNSVKEEMSSYPPLQLPTRGFLLYNNPDLPDTVRFSLSRLTKQLTDISASLKSVNSDGSIINDDVFHNHQEQPTYFCKLKKDSKSIGLKLARSDTCVIYISDIVKGSPAYWEGSISLKDSLLQINGIEVTGKSVAFCKEIITTSKDCVALKLKHNVWLKGCYVSCYNCGFVSMNSHAWFELLQVCGCFYRFYTFCQLQFLSELKSNWQLGGL